MSVLFPSSEQRFYDHVHHEPTNIEEKIPPADIISLVDQIKTFLNALKISKKNGCLDEEYKKQLISDLFIIIHLTNSLSWIGAIEIDPNQYLLPSGEVGPIDDVHLNDPQSLVSYEFLQKHRCFNQKSPRGLAIFGNN